MQKIFKYEEIEQILSEVDELLERIDPEIIKYMVEEQGIQLAQQARGLRILKIEVQDKIANEGATVESGSYSDGVHEAIGDIVKAIEGLALSFLISLRHRRASIITHKETYERNWNRIGRCSHLS